MHTCIEDSGSNPPLLETESAEQTRHSSTNDCDGRVVRNWSVEDELLLGEGLLDGGPSRSPVRRFSPRVFGCSGSTVVWLHWISVVGVGFGLAAD